MLTSSAVFAALAALSVAQAQATVQPPFNRWTTLKVRVTDSIGNGMPGAQVRAASIWSPDAREDTRKFAEAWNRSHEKDVATTDQEGWATMEHMPGDFGVGIEASMEGYKTLGHGLMLQDGGTTIALIQLYQPVWLTGTVWRDGKPVPHAQVTAKCLASGGYLDASVETDSSGRFRITEIPPGEVTLMVESPSPRNTTLLLPSRSGEPLQRPKFVPPDWVAKPIEDIDLREGQAISDLDLTIEKGVLLTGRVVTAEGGRPVSSTTVQIRPGGGVMQWDIPVEDGRFSARVPSGQVFVSIEGVGRNRISRQVHLWADVDADHNPPLELRVPEILARDSIPHVQGKVIDAAGNPVAGAMVANLESDTISVTDDRGRFRFDRPIPAGSLLVVAKVDRMSSQAAEVTSDKELTLKLDDSSFALQGKIVDRHNRPDSAFELTHIGIGADVDWRVGPASVDSKGRYRYRGLVDRYNRFYITVAPRWRSQGPQPHVQRRTSPVPVFQEIRISVLPEVAEGHVVDERGNPMEGVRITRQVAGDPDVLTDAQGYFRLSRGARGSRTARPGDANVVIRLPPSTNSMQAFAFPYY